MSRAFLPRTLENLYSGKIYTGPIAEFIRQQNIPDSQKSRVYEMFMGDGKRPRPVHYKNWYLPEFLKGEMNLKDIYGNEFTINVRDWLRRYSFSSLSKIRRGRIIGGICLSSVSTDKYLPKKNFKINKLTLTRGTEKVSGEKISDVVKNIDICHQSVYSLIYGETDKVKGWEVRGISKKRKNAFKELYRKINDK